MRESRREQIREESVSPYHVLGIEKGATLEEIKSAYRSLLKKYHPDKNPGNPEAATKTKELISAYNKIMQEYATPQEEINNRTPSVEPRSERRPQAEQRSTEESPDEDESKRLARFNGWYQAAWQETKTHLDELEWDVENPTAIIQVLASFKNNLIEQAKHLNLQRELIQPYLDEYYEYQKDRRVYIVKKVSSSWKRYIETHVQPGKNNAIHLQKALDAFAYYGQIVDRDTREVEKWWIENTFKNAENYARQAIERTKQQAIEAAKPWHVKAREVAMESIRSTVIGILDYLFGDDRR